MRELLGAFVSVFLAIALCACSDSLAGDEAGDTSRSNILVDARDLQTYKTVEIGGRVWMAENLNYRVVWERDDFDEYAYFWTTDDDETYEEFALSVRCVKSR